MIQTIHKTKIICTVGPAISSQEKITQLVHAGADAFRLNMSHGSHEIHLESIRIIRSVEKELNRHLTIIADVQGPKIRVGDLPDDGVYSLLNGREVFLADESVWKKLKQPKELIPVRYPTIARDVKPGDNILFDDGLLKIRVISAEGDIVKALVVNGGLLKSRKGINLPNVNVSQPAVTTKDKKDMLFAIKNGCDYVAVSFVRNANDMVNARAFLQQNGGTAWLIAKIEKQEALVNIEKIIEVSDAVMVARGDLGVEIPAAQVPIVQKRIVRLCNERAKPVIIATQMLESMVHNPRPTRAEASDVANAVLDGTDVVMLSAETSVGAWPVEAVAYMRMMCTEAEQEYFYARAQNYHAPRKAITGSRTDSIARAVATITEEMYINGIASLTYTGRTVLFISSRRPAIPIISFTVNDETCRKVNLLWGVRGIRLDTLKSSDETIEMMKTEMVQQGLFASGSTIIMTIGRPLEAHSRTNMISIEKLA